MILGKRCWCGGLLTISQSASGFIGNSHNDYLSGRPNAPADSKFGKMRDNLRLESRTTIPWTGYAGSKSRYQF